MKAILLTILAAAVFAGCKKEGQQTEKNLEATAEVQTPGSTPAPDSALPADATPSTSLGTSNPQVILETDSGTIVLELFPKEAPITVENFLKLVNQKFYDGLIFHRVIPGFMIQGGDPKGNGSGGPGWTIKGEFGPRKHILGALSMARTADPNSAGSQFFICVAAAPHLDGQYAAFGQAISGAEVAVKVASVPRDANDRPLSPVRIKRAYQKK
ncbi:MAG: peptidylprolyl isomerase [candidate division Zixibacteria bacterium]|nr:peptidylprolyl isomerase [candidate division Zixibacteria bacterium]